MERRLVALWTLGIAALALLLASFTGRGEGLAGTGMFAHMAWSYIFGLAILGLVVWLLATRPQTRDAPK